MNRTLYPMLVFRSELSHELESPKLRLKIALNRPKLAPKQRALRKRLNI